MTWLRKLFAVNEGADRPLEKVFYRGKHVGYRSITEDMKVLYADLAAIYRGWLDTQTNTFYDERNARRRRTPEQFLHDLSHAC